GPAADRAADADVHHGALQIVLDGRQVHREGTGVRRIAQGERGGQRAGLYPARRYDHPAGIRLDGRAVDVGVGVIEQEVHGKRDAGGTAADGAGDRAGDADDGRAVGRRNQDVPVGLYRRVVVGVGGRGLNVGLGAVVDGVGREGAGAGEVLADGHTGGD